MSKVIGVAEVKRRFSDVMVEVAHDGKHFIIEKKGKPMMALVNIKDLESIERTSSPSKKKGLLAAIGAWEDFGNMDKFISHVYEKRKTSKERRIKELS
jgi:prevent-host-death family protein